MSGYGEVAENIREVQREYIDADGSSPLGIVLFLLVMATTQGLKPLRIVSVVSCGP